MNSFRKQSRKAFFLIGLITILLVINGFSQVKEDESCEKALARCVMDNVKFLLSFARFANGVVSCVLGYAFCLKYLDK